MNSVYAYVGQASNEQKEIESFASDLDIMNGNYLKAGNKVNALQASIAEQVFRGAKSCQDDNNFYKDCPMWATKPSSATDKMQVTLMNNNLATSMFSPWNKDLEHKTNALIGMPGFVDSAETTARQEVADYRNKFSTKDKVPLILDYGPSKQTWTPSGEALDTSIVNMN